MRGRDEREEKSRERREREINSRDREDSEVVREIFPGLIRPGSNTSYNFHFAYRGNTARPVRLMKTSPSNPENKVNETYMRSSGIDSVRC